MAKKETKSKKTAKTESKFSSFYKEFKENVNEGAKALASISSEVFEDVKDKAEDLYEKGSDKFVQASGVVESYTNKFKGEKEIRHLSKEKEELCAFLGDAIFHEFKKNGTVSKRFLTTKKSEQLISSIEEIDKKTLKIGKALDKASKTKMS